MTFDFAWQNVAACQGMPLILFFGPDNERAPERHIRERAAKAICDTCTVQADCLDYAVKRPEKDGTWGGLGPDERAGERRRWQRRTQTANRAEAGAA
jgi:WhiB family redox-sensing transcriptional regulator